MNLAWYLDFSTRFSPFFLKGAAMTLQLLLLSACLSLFLGTVLGVLTSNRLKIPLLSASLDFLTFVLRGIPFFVQLLIVYFVLPDLLGCNLEPFPASILALGICSSGYMAQIIRGGVNAISTAQWESAFSLGFNKIQSFVHIILPQTFRTCLPMLNNEIDALLKSTSIVSSIGMLELTRVGMNIVSREMQPVPVYLTIAFLYICMSATLNILTRYIERRAVYAKS